MPKEKTPLQRAAGKLISAIQKIWIAEGGESNADFSLDVMDAAHAIAQARDAKAMLQVLDGKSLRQYLGDVWVQRFPSVKPAIEQLEAAIHEELATDR